MPRHATMHAAGVVITDKPVSDYVPLSKNDDNVVTQFTMTALEELGLLKMDFLGLRNLTVINDAEKQIKHKNPDYNPDMVDENDKKVFEMFSKGYTEGVFQFESQGMKNVLTQLKPERIEDLIAVTALYRPGPMDSIPVYIDCRHNPSHIRYKHPLLKEILGVTSGCIIYQEQVMQIFRTLAGYSLGRADIVRRAMSKKKLAVMESEREIFIHGLTDDDGNIIVEGCIRRGVDEKRQFPFMMKWKALHTTLSTNPMLRHMPTFPTKLHGSNATIPANIWRLCFQVFLIIKINLRHISLSANGSESVYYRLMSTKAIFILQSAETISVTDFLPLKISAEIS